MIQQTNGGGTWVSPLGPLKCMLSGEMAPSDLLTPGCLPLGSPGKQRTGLSSSCGRGLSQGLLLAALPSPMLPPWNPISKTRDRRDCWTEQPLRTFTALLLRDLRGPPSLTISEARSLCCSNAVHAGRLNTRNVTLSHWEQVALAPAFVSLRRFPSLRLEDP